VIRDECPAERCPPGLRRRPSPGAHGIPRSLRCPGPPGRRRRWRAFPTIGSGPARWRWPSGPDRHDPHLHEVHRVTGWRPRTRRTAHRVPGRKPRRSTIIDRCRIRLVPFVELVW